MNKNDFIKDIENCVEILKKQVEKKVTLVHHNDADGLTSAAIMQTVLFEEGFEIKRIPLERVHPPIINKIHQDNESIIMYLDLGSKASPVISDANQGKNLTIILDHHHPEKPTDDKVICISSESYGISGNMDASCAAIIYKFATIYDKKYEKLAYLGVIGAVGDAHDRYGSLVNDNREVMLRANELGQIKIEKSGDKETYILTLFDQHINTKDFAKKITVLGAAGYYSEGPEIGIEMCKNGPHKKSNKYFSKYNKKKEKIFNKTVKKLAKKKLFQTEHIQWFSVENSFSPMGVKMIGEFCMDMRNEDFIDPDKYIVGCQIMPNTIPSVGKFDWSLYKVSMRLPKSLEQKVMIDKTMPSLAYLVPEAAKKVGGSIDGCHDYAAATVIEKNLAERYMQEMENLIQEELKKKKS